MQTELSRDKIRKIIIEELPKIMEGDHEVRKFIFDLTSERYADKEKTEDKIYRVLDELKADREKSDKRWAAWEKKWEKHTIDQEKKWDAQEKKWEKNQKNISKILYQLDEHDNRFESTMGALGARWGINSESAFRNGLRAILEKSFNVKVERINEMDKTGTVFGRPDQVELDILIYNGLLIICELKSSMSKSDVYIFERKVRYYEKEHGKSCDRMIIISPMVDDRAKRVAEELNIEVYSYAGNFRP